MPPDSYEEQKQRQNLWRCDCVDDGRNTDPDSHESDCNYVRWYDKQDFGKGGDE